MNKIDLNNRCAVVTGGAQGFGKAITERFVASGAKVAIWDHDHALAEKTAKAIGSAVTAIKVDVSETANVEKARDATLAAFGKIDILVNNAGIAITRGVDDLTEDDFDRTIAVNLKSAFLVTQAVLPAMRARKWGRIVNISSGAARGAGAIGPHYNASKAGMEGLTRGYAARLVKEGITVNAVAPSLIETEMVTAPAETAARVPLGRLGLPEEVAQAVLMVIGNAYMTGQTIPVNGGLHFY
jgi:3-oxoacyl-[acyl-carrier protein] reductase